MSDLRVDGCGDSGTPSKRDPESSSSSAPPLAARLVEPPLDVIRHALGNGDYHNREDWGSEDPKISAEAAVAVLLAEIDRLQAGRLVDPQLTWRHERLRDWLETAIETVDARDLAQSIGEFLVDPSPPASFRSLLERAVNGLTQGACFTCGAEPGVNIDCPGCRWVSDAQAALLAARVDPSPPAQSRDWKAEAFRAHNAMMEALTKLEAATRENDRLRAEHMEKKHEWIP